MVARPSRPSNQMVAPASRPDESRGRRPIPLLPAAIPNRSASRPCTSAAPAARRLAAYDVRKGKAGDPAADSTLEVAEEVARIL